ncbi:MAG: hypothetical protein CVV03_12015 [Firmicutes bacterium HGW-Firmicutes-8]|nr:MAG: hypothetical protein CVV03_12015 [Firmicutes bacterium HGW-Firmicutes-8]
MLNRIKNSLTGKLVSTLILTLFLLVSIYTVYTVQEDKKIVEGHLERKGFALAKGAALALQTMVENDIKKGVITEKALFDRDYKLIKDDTEAKNRKYSSAFDSYTDTYWQGFVDAFLADEDVLFAAPVANGEGDKAGYLPTHNTKYKDRSKRIFNDSVGVGAGNTKEPLKQVYKRDTGEVAWDISHPIYINGKHWGGFRVALSVASIEAQLAAKRNKTILSMVLLAVILTTVIFIIARIMLSKPLNKILKATEDLAVGDGDLTQRLDISSNDELGIISRHINTFIEKIQVVVRDLAEMIEKVASVGELVSSNSEEGTKATQQVASAIEQVAKGSTEQSRSITDTVQVVTQVSQAIEQIAAGAQEQSKNVINTSAMVTEMANKIDTMAEGMETVKQVSEQNGVVATKGGQAVDKTVNGMLQVKDAVFETANKIHELGEQSQKIGEIIQVIDDIAEQTNLLALNAAIEAARAGEHGKGFAVVADEVRKLAERSGKATKEIADLITDIQRGTKVAVESMQVGTKEVESGVELAQEAGQSLQEIVQGVKTAGEQVHKIMSLINEILNSSKVVSAAVNNVAAITEENNAATEEMSASVEQVNASMQNMASISEESAASAEEVSASTEELTASVEEISSSSEQLAKMAQELQSIVAQFRV